MAQLPEEKVSLQKKRNYRRKEGGAPNLVFHKLRLLRQALKKAKQFEVRKLCRRMHAEVKAKTDAVDAEALQRKWEAKLSALKSACLDDIFACACRKLQVEPDGSSLSSEAPGAEVPVEEEESSMQSWAVRRILGTGCVVEAIASTQIQLAATAAAATDKIENGDRDEQEEGPLDAEIESISEQKKMNKLLPSSRRRQRTSAEVRRSENARKKERDKGSLLTPEEQSDYQGDSAKGKVIVDDHQGKKLGRKRRRATEDSEAEAEASTVFKARKRAPVGQKREGARRPGSLLKGVPHKPKNRLGQRERRRLAEKAAAAVTGLIRMEQQQQRPHGDSAGRLVAREGGRHHVSSSRGARQEQQQQQQLQRRGGASRSLRPPISQALADPLGRHTIQSQAGTSGRHSFSSSSSRALEAAGQASPTLIQKRHLATSRTKNKAQAPASPGVQQPAEQLHPSWAAKRAMERKLGMAGTGVKIKFSEDE